MRVTPKFMPPRNSWKNVTQFEWRNNAGLPSAEERGRLLEMLRQRSSRVESLKSLLWALLTSREFAYNH